MIHRDVKPSNILLQNSVQRVKITDFGLARATDDVGMTKTGEVTGTPQYMSPEQAQGLPVDTRSDLFSLGSVLYAMCTGRSPFRAETSVASLRRVCDDTPRPVREINPDVPDWFVEIIDRLLEKDANDRFQTAEEVSELLGRHLAHVQDPGSTPFPGATRALPQQAPRTAGHRQRWAVACLVLLAVCVTLGVTEATNVTNVAEYFSTVLRIRTPYGTLVLEIEDPNVEVAVAGNGEELTISGAGIENLQLTPGDYEIRTTRDGEPVKQELVTITRGDREVMRVSVEPVEGGTNESLSDQPYSSEILLADDWTWTMPVNLGALVNSDEHEMAPYLSADGLTLLFASTRADGLEGMDLWCSKRSSGDAEWSAAVNLGPLVNSIFNEHGPALTTDGLTMLFTSDRPGGFGQWDLWVCTRDSVDADWSPAVNLGPKINGPWGEGGPTLSTDGLVLLFHSSRPEGAGGDDMWVSTRASLDAEWTEPIWLGSEINSEHDERGACLSADGRALIFASDRSTGNEVFDLWISRSESPIGPWSRPVKLGAFVNSDRVDSAASLSADGQTLLFESGRAGNSDLWMTRRVPGVDHFSLGVEYARQKRHQEAAQELSLALDLASRSTEHDAIRKAIVRHIYQSDDLFERVMELRVGDINLWRERAFCLAEDGRWREAADSYRKRLELGPDGAGCWAAYALALLACDDVDAYREVCAEILEVFSGVQHPNEKATAAWTLAAIPDAVEDKQRALELAEVAHRSDPENMPNSRTFAMWLYRTDQLEQAVSVIEELPPDDCDPSSLTGDILPFAAMAHWRLGNSEEAGRWVDRADAWVANAQAGAFPWQSATFARAMSEEMDQLLPRGAGRPGRLNRAVALAEEGQVDEAAREFSAALDLIPDSSTDRRRVHILEQVLQWEGMFDRLVELRPDDINLWRERGGIKASESQWDEAANCLRKRLDLGPDGGGTWNWCAIALLAIDDDEGYRELCARMLTEFQHNPNPFERRDIAWAAVYAPINDEDRERGLESAEKALAGLSEDGDVFRLYAAWLYRHDRLEEATEWFDRSVDQGGLWEGQGEFAWCFAAMALHRLGQEEQASRWRKQVLEWRESLNERLTPEYSWWPVVGDRLIEEMNRVFAGATGGPESAVRDGDRELPPPPTTGQRSDIKVK